jgi:hypothetical protein
VEDVDDMQCGPAQSRLLQGTFDHEERMVRTVDTGNNHHLSPTFSDIVH